MKEGMETPNEMSGETLSNRLERRYIIGTIQRTLGCDEGTPTEKKKDKPNEKITIVWA